MLEVAAELQDKWEDSRTCAVRRADRYPCEVCLIAIWARSVLCPLQREARMRHVRWGRRRIWARERLAKLADAVRQGRVPERDMALKDVAAIKQVSEWLEDEHTC